MRTGRLTRLFRVSRLALHLVRGLFTAAFFFPFQSADARAREVKRWSARLLSILAVRLHVHGEPVVARPLMLVANHVSWLDIFAIDAILPARFVAKSEIRSWPLLGWLCERAGTLFLERARRRDTARINDEVVRDLRGGGVFAVFPEGTTSDGSSVLKFHASLLAPAVDANACVQPVAIRYLRADGSLCTEAAYDGDKTFWSALLSMLTQSRIDGALFFLPAITHAQQHRRELADSARAVIVEKLLV